MVENIHRQWEAEFMKTNRRRTRARDPLLGEIEQELCLGRFIRYGDMFDFVRHLEQVEKKLAALVTGEEAERTVGLYEAFLAGCYEKIEECDDSGGYLGMFWGNLFCGWLKARQAAGCPSSETVQQILKWKGSDDYGFCYEIEKDVAKVLDFDAYEMFVSHFRKAVEDGLSGLQGPKPGAIFEYDNSIRLPAMSLKDHLSVPGGCRVLCSPVRANRAQPERLQTPGRNGEGQATLEAGSSVDRKGTGAGAHPELAQRGRLLAGPHEARNPESSGSQGRCACSVVG